MRGPSRPRSARRSRDGDDDQRRRRLRRLYVLAAAGLAALVPLVLFGGFWVRAELGKSQRDVDTYLSVRALDVSRRVDSELEHQLVALRALSALPALDTASPDVPTVTERVRSVMAHWRDVALIETGTGTVASSTRPGWPPPQAIAAAAAAADTRTPRLETAAELGVEGSDIFMFMPVVRNDAVRGVLVASLDAKDLQDIANDQSREADLLVVLVDEAQRVLARSRGAEPQGGRSTRPDLGDATGGQAAGQFRSTSDQGEALSSAFVRSPLTGWISVVSMNQKQIDRMSTRPVWATIAAGALSLLLAAILAVFVVTTVVERRVTDERLAASRALGELDSRLLATTQEALDEQRKAASEREVLLREIYHRVKNNLQIVQSLLRLGSRDLSPEQREPFESAVRRIGAMARVHTLLYNSPDLASIDFKDYLGELLRELSEGFGADERSISSALAANPMRVPLDTAVPLAFIAVEILTNSYRHAFPPGRAGKITVEIQRDENLGILVIEDDGIGLTKGSGSRRRLGLTIVRKLVQQIGGAIEEPEPGASRFVIRFPLGETGAGWTPAEAPASA